MCIYICVNKYINICIYDICTCMLWGSASFMRTDCNSIYMYI